MTIVRWMMDARSCLLLDVDVSLGLNGIMVFLM